MKQFIINTCKKAAVRLLAITAFFACAGLWGGLTGCKKERLFTHLDSIPEIPSQFHFLNNFVYDSALALTIDGLYREQVSQLTFSKYYSTSSAFNQNTGQSSSKLININNPVIKSLFANTPDNSIFRFQPNTSYVVFAEFAGYDTTYNPKNTVVPRLICFPEDVYHPFPGTTGIRLFRCMPGYSSVNVSVAPNIGQGTATSLFPVYTGNQPEKSAKTYETTQAGLKRITVSISTSPAIQLTYRPFMLHDGRNYSFFVVGDPQNFLNRKEPRPRLLVAEDGNPASLQEPVLENLSYPGSSGYSEVTVVNGAFNVSGYIPVGSAGFVGLDARFNENTVNVIRWPVYNGMEDVNLVESFPMGGTYQMTRRVAGTVFQPGNYAVSVAPGSGFSPVYDQFNYDFQKDMSYSVCLLPDVQSAGKTGHLVLEDDKSPDPNQFKVRFVNMLGGAREVDIHLNSSSGPVIASSVPYGGATEYISLQPNPASQKLYVTAAGSTAPLFQLGTYDQPILTPFRGGNSGTIFLMGLLAGTPYGGDPGYFKPYVYYKSDAFNNSQSALPNTQLYYQL